MVKVVESHAKWGVTEISRGQAGSLDCADPRPARALDVLCLRCATNHAVESAVNEQKGNGCYFLHTLTQRLKPEFPANSGYDTNLKNG